MARATDKRWKGILIDWEEIADMDAEDYELKPLNQQQAAILLALLEYQKWPTRWLNLDMSQDELETYIADIEQRLMRNEGGGMATKEDIRDGLYEAMNRLALQIATGQYANIALSTDEDGTVSIPEGEETPELPEDDSSTPFDDTLAAEMGGTIAVSRALEILYDQIDTYYGGTNGSPAVPQADALVFLKAYFPVDENALSTAISAYYAYRATNPRLLWDVTATIQNWLFCKGGLKSAWNRWLSSQSGFAIAKFNAMFLLSDALAPEFWTGYFQEGMKIPSTQYLDASCVKIQPQTLTNIVFAVQRSSTIIKPLHRYLWKVKGYALDVDGDTQDWFWYRTAAGVNTFTTPSVVHSAAPDLPSSTQVPYNAAHEYQYTVDSENLANNPYLITLNKHANMNATGLTYPIPFEVTIEDLGEYAV